MAQSAALHSVCRGILFLCALLPSWAGAADWEWAATKRLIRARFGEVRQLSTAELAAWLADDTRERPLLLDTRRPEEYAVSHLEGAMRAESPEEAERLLQGQPTDRPVVLYCSVGYRSSRLARQLMQAGYTQVYNLEGSIFAWANEGRVVVDETGPVHKVHPYDERWGRLLRFDLRAAPESEK